MTTRNGLISVTAAILVIVVAWQVVTLHVFAPSHLQTPKSVNSVNTSQQVVNADFAFLSQQSTTNHPVFVSSHYHFEYRPVGNFGYTIGQARGMQQFIVGVTSQDAKSTNKGIELSVYPNNVQLVDSNLAAFRAWRKENIYDNSSDEIASVVIRGLNFLKATQVYGIDSHGDYYYLIQPDFVYVFYFPGETPLTAVTSSLTGFAITNIASPLSSTSLLDQYNVRHLTAAQSTQLITDIHDPKKFTTPQSQGNSLVGDCGQSANVEKLKKLNALRTAQVVNGVYHIVRTPNTEKWTAATADTFMSDPTVVCGVGFFFPFEVTPDYVLWRNACSSGMLPTDANGKLLPDFVHCIQAQEVISKEYNLQD